MVVKQIRNAVQRELTYIPDQCPLLGLVHRLVLKVSNGAKIRNQNNQVPHLTQDTNGKVSHLQGNFQIKLHL